MAEYEFEKHYIPGVKSAIADFLSKSIESAKINEAGGKWLGIVQFLIKVADWEELHTTVLIDNKGKYKTSLEEVKRFLKSWDGTSVSIRVRQRAKPFVVIKGTLTQSTW